MKCLCCNGNFEGLGSLEQHYVEAHNVDENNYFFRKLLTRDRYFCPRKCFRCDYFCCNGRDEKVHNFLEHYQQGGTLSSEEKPVKLTHFDGDLQKCCITFNEYGEFFDFYNPREVISEFLIVFEQDFCFLKVRLRKLGLSVVLRL